MRDSLKMLLVGSISMIIIACAASPLSESTGEYLDSSTTTAKVKASLVDQLGTTGFAVKVKTYKDQVQLSGFVDSQKIKQRAGIIAAGIDGVKSVRNDLIIKTR
ncbi:BON domain-containing protein [Legionella pneumophila]|uniref:BON domain-containing protein n=1 Tax=Legionella pneumophila TaxID=446 RepID=UPI00048A3158|nr:BON domain-containing protein [Legionella pneumophila]MCZ4705469.1 BON domain-containing protein [Legionella pneumophila]MCZ4714692.1 BON domain-containing protein [Legionella pneumophila]CZH43504.1 Osmotically-inducible protein Y precursor [Legionella pneumophila]CZH79135.1 Osmotically-inducible protein Y precursor [Legionella pneumophila]HAT1728166.1 BON domain-containing protein [Legionella pneumophila]